jgi:glutamine synthetase
MTRTNHSFRHLAFGNATSLRGVSNPYLAAAAILAAAHLGVRNAIDPGPPVEGNGYAQASRMLPTDWLSALESLAQSRWAKETFGQGFLTVYLAIKRAEYRAFADEVSEQDWRWYLHQA